MLNKDANCLANILEAIVKIENYIVSFLDTEEIWQIIHHKIPPLKLFIEKITK